MKNRFFLPLDVLEVKSSPSVDRILVRDFWRSVWKGSEGVVIQLRREVEMLEPECAEKLHPQEMAVCRR